MLHHQFFYGIALVAFIWAVANFIDMWRMRRETKTLSKEYQGRKDSIARLEAENADRLLCIDEWNKIITEELAMAKKAQKGKRASKRHYNCANYYMALVLKEEGKVAVNNAKIETIKTLGGG